MSDEKDGGHAFPQLSFDKADNIAWANGMTLRELYVGVAALGTLSGEGLGRIIEGLEQESPDCTKAEIYALLAGVVADSAGIFADAMLKEREEHANKQAPVDTDATP